MANIASIGSLFKKAKNDPEFAESQQLVRLSLLKTLSRAIKEVQLLSTECEEGGRVGDCQATQRLATRFENALRHGLKARWFGQSYTFWPLVLKISRKQAIEYISGLQYAVSETGRCRAWIRMAVNECSLESYIGVICQNSSLRSQHYETHAFMRDEDVVGPLQQLLAGLSQINFNITVDTASLEYEAVPEALIPPLQLRLPQHLLENDEVHRKKRRRKPKSSSRSRDRHVTPIEMGSHDHHVTPIEKGSHDRHVTLIEDSDEESSDIQSLNDEEEEVEEGRGGEVGGGEFEGILRGSKGGEVSGGGIEEQVALLDNTHPGEEEKGWEMEDILSDSDRSQRCEAGSFQTEERMAEMVEVSDHQLSPVRGVAGGSGEGEECEDGAGGGELRDGGMNMMEDGLANQIEDSNQDEFQDRDRDNFQDMDQEKFQDRDQDEFQDRDQDNVAKSLEDHLQDTLLVTSHSQDADIEDEKEKGALEGNESHDLVEASRQSPDSRPVVASPDHLRMGPPLQLREPVNLDLPDTVSNRKQPFEDHTHSIYDQINRNPFDDSSSLTPSPPHTPPPPDKDLATPTANDSVQNGFLPTLINQPPHPTTTTTNPFDSPCATPSPPLTSPSSSDFFRGESPSLAHRQGESLAHCHEGEGGGKRRVLRADSLEWSLYMEQNMVDLPGGVASSELALEEDHYSPELGMAELQEMIQRLKKDLISSSSPLSPVEQHALRRKIVHLQLQLQSKKEEEESEAPYEEVSGHKFVRQPRQRRVLRDASCLACKKRVRGLIREWFRCKTCQSVCHKKCLSSVVNQCSLPGDDVEYILEVCPEVGLTEQQFRCLRCNHQLTQTPPVEVRLCDYDGRYYCPDCHSNDLALIPARVIHNWDFVPRPVCCQCSLLLLHLSSRPLLRVQSGNPLLYTHVQDLTEVERIRRDLLHMKTFLAICQLARDQQLLHRLDVFPHYKEDSTLLTLHEMVEIQNGSLLPALNDIHRCFAKHITTDCQDCSSRGQTCPLCSSADLVFPFGHQVSLCPNCSTTFHKDCFSEVSSCPTCHRKT